MNTQIVTLTKEDINSRVNGSNKFSKEEVGAYRPHITAARKEKRERLHKMSSGAVSSVIASAMDGGFRLHDQKQIKLKTADVIRLELRRSHTASQSAAKALITEDKALEALGLSKEELALLREMKELKAAAEKAA